MNDVDDWLQYAEQESLDPDDTDAREEYLDFCREDRRVRAWFYAGC